MGELGAFHVHFNLLCPKTRALELECWCERCSLHLWGAAADLCLTLSDRSPRGSPGCPYGPSPRESAAERAASAGAAALVPKSPAGADSSCPSLQVSEGETEAHIVTFNPSESDCEFSFCYCKDEWIPNITCADRISVVLHRSRLGETTMDHNWND